MVGRSEQQPLTPMSSRLKTEVAGIHRIGLGVVLLIFLGFGGWAAFAPLNSASVSVGEVFVVSNNRVVQHLEGGLVSRIHVEEGEEVIQGQTLLELSPIKVQSELDVVEGHWIENWAKSFRLIAERDGLLDIEFEQSGVLLGEHKSLLIDEVKQGQIDIFNARRTALNSEVGLLKHQAKIIKLQVQGLEATNLALQTQIESYQSDIKDFETLVKRQLTDKTRMHEMQRDLAERLGQFERNQVEILRLKQTALNLYAEAEWLEQRFLEEVVSELRQVQTQSIELGSRLVSLRDQWSRIHIRSPIDGTVKGLSIYSVGEVVGAGEVLMDVVPRSKQFAIKSRVLLNDVNEVKVGLLADVRFSAFNTQTTYRIEGRVVHLSADRFIDTVTGQAYFEARVELTELGVEMMEREGIFLMPGMPAEVLIQTGERTLLSYILKPFTDRLARAFNEN